MATGRTPRKTAELAGSAGRYNPLAVRFPPEDRDWLADERIRTGESVNSIIVTAVRQYRNRRTAAQKRSQA